MYTSGASVFHIYGELKRLRNDGLILSIRQSGPVDLLVPAKYPFLGEASEAIIQNSVDIADLFGGSLYEDARIRGLARVEEALLHSEVSYSPLVKDYDRLNDILSYPYARILVSVIDDRFLTKRYALRNPSASIISKGRSPATILQYADPSRQST